MDPTTVVTVDSIRVRMLSYVDDDLSIVYISPNGSRTVLQDLQRNIGEYDTFPYSNFIDSTFTRGEARALGVEMDKDGLVEVACFDGWAGAYRVSPYVLTVNYTRSISLSGETTNDTYQVSLTSGIEFQGVSDVLAPNPQPPDYYQTGPHFATYYVMGTHRLVLPLINNVLLTLPPPLPTVAPRVVTTTPNPLFPLTVEIATTSSTTSKPTTTATTTAPTTTSTTDAPSIFIRGRDQDGNACDECKCPTLNF